MLYSYSWIISSLWKENSTKRNKGQMADFRDGANLVETEPYIYIFLWQKVRKCFKEMIKACQKYIGANLKEIPMVKYGTN